jgi:predicted GIY-YIG superfamily endonuclease
MKSFDKKFGNEFVSALPTLPGVYRIYDSAGSLIYVGKAKNLRRRLSQYRNAKRRKKHLKMLSIVKSAVRIEFETFDTEVEACLRETKLIQQFRPRWNIAGAFYFLYPMIGMRHDCGVTYFCLTTHPERFPEMRQFGAFRSRHVTGEAFFSLMRLLEYIGHPVPTKKLRRELHSYHFAFRQLPAHWVELLARFWKGESNEAIETLVLALIENAGARRRSRETQDHLNHLKRFWKHEATTLRKAIASSGYLSYPVTQLDRDLIFLTRRYSPSGPIPRLDVSRSESL